MIDTAELPASLAPAALMPAGLRPSGLMAAGGSDDWDARLGAVEAFGAQLGQAVEQLVDAVVTLQEQQQAAAPAPQLAGGAEAALAALGALNGRLVELEQQFALERSCRDLERVSRMHPKERTVVFVATTYFGCNVKYAWLAFREIAQREGITAWLLPQNAEQERMAKDLGEPCFPHRHADWSADHLHAALAAAVVVTCDHLLSPNPYAGALLAGARHVQLWHGISIKEIGLRNLAAMRHMTPRFAKVLATTGPYTRLVGTAATAENEWRRWFAFERYAPIGYPRNDVLLREPTIGDLLNVDTEMLAAARAAREAGKRVVLYAPTFRDAKRGVWAVEAGVERLAQELAKRGDLLIVNLHPVEQPMIPQLREQIPSARFVAPRTDIYPLLPHTTELVTDYSSVMFDYLLLDRPILLFRPDHAAYVARSRQLFDDKLDAKPGPMLSSVTELLLALRNRAAETPTYARQRRELCERLHDHRDGQAGERLGALLIEELGLALDA
ncbi:MAG TPA: CDP-glycerol glycerophosphotransferase family protein [Ideonella sp.]|nr:CDP-glycerol glycerophosphotransferase family protein [Ideonella sp.]